MELSQAISQAINEFGKDIITEPRFVNILADYDAFAESRVTRVVVKDMVEQGFTKRLLSDDLKVNNIDDKICSLIYDAQNIFPFREDLLLTVISAFISSVTVYTSPKKSVNKNTAKKVQELPSNPLSHFEVSEDGKTLLKAKDHVAGVVVIPKGIKVIGENAFADNAKITKVIIPEGVSVIEFRAFSYCSKLSDVQLPKSLRELESCCLSNCTELKSIFLPKNVKKIGFDLCCGEVNVDPNNKYYKSCNGSVFSKESTTLYHVPHDVKYYDVPEGVARIYHAFSGCRCLESVRLPDSLRVIDNAFCGCDKLNYRVHFKKSVLTDFLLPFKSIRYNKRPFLDFLKWTHYIKLPEGLEEILESSFWGTDSLSEITIPASVKVIDVSAFEYSGISKIVLSSNSPESIMLCDKAYLGLVGYEIEDCSFDPYLLGRHATRLESIYISKKAYNRFNHNNSTTKMRLIPL